MEQSGGDGLKWCAMGCALLLFVGCGDSGGATDSDSGGVSGVTPPPVGTTTAADPTTTTPGPSSDSTGTVDTTPPTGDTGMQDTGMDPVMPPPGDGSGGTGGVDVMDPMGGTGGTGGMEMMMPPTADGACTPAPPGSFATELVTGTGPDGNYTIARPTNLGEGGFLHPPVAWGNGLGTTPSLYVALLENLASNGFVVIANPGTGSNPTVVRDGLEWLIAQNGSGEYAGKLAADCAGTIGYSMGGGAAVGSGSHPAVKAIVSIHGLQDAAERASGPILLTTSEGDTFVTKSGFVEPCYQRSSVQPTILASHAAGDHLDPLGTGGMDAEPAIAWLRYWIYGDQSQRSWFFGDDCTLCSWPDFRRKNHPEWD